MKKMLTLLLGLVSTFTSVSQNLDNTVWSFPPEKVAQLQGAFPGLDSVKIFFEAPDLFYTINYTNGNEATVFDGSYNIDVPTNSGQVVDSTDGSTSCNAIDVVTFDYEVLDTVLTFSNVLSPTCNIWQILIPGDYYLDAALTTNGLNNLNSLDFNMFPNPAKNQVTFSEHIELVELFDLNGRRILVGENCSTINLENLDRGIYQTRVKKGNQQGVQKLIIE